MKFKKIDIGDLTPYEMNRRNIYEDIKSSKFTTREISIRNKVSKWTVLRIKKSIKSDEIFSFSHKNKGNKYGQKYSDELIDLEISKMVEFSNAVFVQELDKKRNVTIAAYLRNNESLIPEKTFYRRSVEMGFATEHSHKKTRRIAKKNAKNILNKTEKETIVYYVVNERLETLKTIEKNALIKNTWKSLSPGMVVEIDATQDTMGLGEKFHTYHAIDAATGKLLAIHVEKEETNIGYMNLLEKVFRIHGIPQVIKTDRRTTFWKIESSYTPITEFLRSLGVDVQSSSVAQFKSFVERSFKTAQLNYPIFFMKNNIKQWTEIRNFENELIEFFNSISPKLDRNTDKNCFRKISEGEPGWYVDYNFKNKIHSGAVKYLNNYYAPIDNEGHRVNFSKKVKLTFCMNSLGEFILKTDNNRYKTTTDSSAFTQQEIYLIGKNLDIWDDLPYAVSKIVLAHKGVVRTFNNKIDSLIRYLTEFNVDTTKIRECAKGFELKFKKAINWVEKEIKDYYQ